MIGYFCQSGFWQGLGDTGIWGHRDLGTQGFGDGPFFPAKNRVEHALLSMLLEKNQKPFKLIFKNKNSND